MLPEDNIKGEPMSQTGEQVKSQEQLMEEQYQVLLDSFSYEGANLAAHPNVTDEMVDGLYAYAYGYYTEGLYTESEQLFRILTAVRIKSTLYWKGLGAALQMLKKHKEAVEAYSWAAIHDDKFSDPYPHFYAAECLHTLGDIPRGLKALESAKFIAKKRRDFPQLVEKIELLQSIWKKK